MSQVLVLDWISFIKRKIPIKYNLSVEAELTKEIVSAVEDGLNSLVVQVGPKLILEEPDSLLQGGTVLGR